MSLGDVAMKDKIEESKNKKPAETKRNKPSQLPPGRPTTITNTIYLNRLNLIAVTENHAFDIENLSTKCLGIEKNPTNCI